MSEKNADYLRHLVIIAFDIEIAREIFNDKCEVNDRREYINMCIGWFLTKRISNKKKNTYPGT